MVFHGSAPGPRGFATDCTHGSNGCADLGVDWYSKLALLYFLKMLMELLDRLLPSHRSIPAPFTQDECQELMGLLRSFGGIFARDLYTFYLIIILLKITWWIMGFNPLFIRVLFLGFLCASVSVIDRFDEEFCLTGRFGSSLASAASASGEASSSRCSSTWPASTCAKETFPSRPV